MALWSNSTPANSLAIVTSPTAHDVLIAGLVFDSTGPTISTWPTGFTQVGAQSTTADGQTLIVGIKNDASGSEGTLTFGSSNTMIGFVLSVSGRDNTTPQDITAVVVNSNTAVSSPFNLSSGSFTPATNGDVIVAVMGGDIQSGNDVVFSFSTTSGTTGSWSVDGDIGSGFYNIGVGTATQTTAGAITVQSTGTSNGNSLAGAAILLALKPTSGGAATHTTTGALTGQLGSVAGTAAHKTLHATSGTLAGSGSSLVGTSVNYTIHATSGVLSGQGSALSGAALRFRAHAASGVLSADAASLSGTAAVTTAGTFSSSGVLVGQGSVIEGVALRYRAHATSGAIAGPGAVIVGTANIAVEHTTSGDLVGPSAVVVGSATGPVLFSVSGGGGGTQKKRNRVAVLEVDGKEYIIPANDVQSFLNALVKPDKKKQKKQETKPVPVVAPVVTVVEVSPEIAQVVAQKVDRTNELLMAVWKRAIERELEEEEDLICLLAA